jgi:hypothetical protein
MKHVGVPQAITAYAIPPHAPPAVAEAKSGFDRIAERWASVKGELADAVQALETAKQADLEHIVKMAELGKDVLTRRRRRAKPRR